MAWMASHLFVKAADLSRVVASVERLLDASEHRADPEGVLGEPPPVIVSPAVEGWVTVCALRGWVSDLPWAAERVAEELGTTSISSELLGNSYRLRLAVYGASGRVSGLQHPDLPWGSAPEHEGPMPLYEDVERLAFERLRELGLPVSSIALGVTPFRVPAPRPLDLGTGQSLARASGARPIEQRALEVLGYSLPEDEPPVVPHEVGQGFGVVLFEHRYVEGQPTDKGLARLFELEEALASRASRAAGGARVNLTVTYHGGQHQDELDEELRARGRFVPPSTRTPQTPWWQFWAHFGFSRRR